MNSHLSENLLKFSMPIFLRQSVYIHIINSLGIKENTVPWIEMILIYHSSVGMLEVKKKDISNIYFISDTS